MSQTRRELVVTTGIAGVETTYVVNGKPQMQNLLFGLAARHWRANASLMNTPIPRNSRRSVIDTFFNTTTGNYFHVAACLVPPETTISKMVVEGERKIARQTNTNPSKAVTV